MSAAPRRPGLAAAPAGILLACIAGALLAGCGDDTPSPLPAGYGGLAVTRDPSGCPDLAGRFDLRPDDRAARLLGRVRNGTQAIDTPHETPSPALPGSLWIEPDPGTRWRFVLRPRGRREVDTEVRVPDKRLACRRGWLEHRGIDGPFDWRLGRLADRSLVLQVAQQVPEQIDLWCGDGCKGIPTGHHRADEFVVAFEVGTEPVPRDDEPGSTTRPVVSAAVSGRAPSPVDPARTPIDGAPRPAPIDASPQRAVIDVAPLLALVPEGVEVERLEARGATAELACVSSRREALAGLREALMAHGYRLEATTPDAGPDGRWRLVGRITRP